MPSPELKAMGGVWTSHRLKTELTDPVDRKIGIMVIPVELRVEDVDALVAYVMSIPVISARDPSDRDCVNWNLLRDQ